MKGRLPIKNIPVIEFTRRWIMSNGNISAKAYLLIIVYYIKLILVMPAAYMQRLLYSKKIRQTEIQKQPVFILGHYRSGTTYLHKLVSADKRWGYISYYDILCPNSSLLFGKLQKNIIQFFINLSGYKTSFFNNTIPNLDEPAEEERFLINKGSAYTDYWKFVFPLCWSRWPSVAQLCIDEDNYEAWAGEYKITLQLAAYKNKGKQLILKSPQNTERIKYLLKMFPGAKFIYISRNPYHVFYSMQNLWQRAIKKFCLQKISDEQIDEIIFKHYNNVTGRYETDKTLIPPGNLIEVNYEDIKAKPLTILKKIYTSLNLTGYNDALKNFTEYLEKEKTYKAFTYNYTSETFMRIDRHWPRHIDSWNKKKEECCIKR